MLLESLQMIPGVFLLQSAQEGISMQSQAYMCQFSNK